MSTVRVSPDTSPFRHSTYGEGSSVGGRYGKSYRRTTASPNEPGSGMSLHRQPQQQSDRRLPLFTRHLYQAKYQLTRLPCEKAPQESKQRGVNTIKHGPLWPRLDKASALTEGTKAGTVTRNTLRVMANNSLQLFK